MADYPEGTPLRARIDAAAKAIQHSALGLAQNPGMSPRDYITDLGAAVEAALALAAPASQEGDGLPEDVRQAARVAYQRDHRSWEGRTDAAAEVAYAAGLAAGEARERARTAEVLRSERAVAAAKAAIIAWRPGGVPVQMASAALDAVRQILRGEHLDG